jgi:hypothetical protein
MIRKPLNVSYLRKYMNAKTQLLERFKAAFPNIVELNPEIEVRHVTEDESGICDYFEIHITCPFIFDVRLIPEVFEGMRV